MDRNEALQSMKSILLNRRDALRSALRGDLTALCELALASGDIADFALDTAHEEVTSQLAEGESRELTQIEEAIERLQRGAYGECEDCQKPIPLARLEALPYAKMCIKCQLKSENTGFKGWSSYSGEAYDAFEHS